MNNVMSTQDSMLVAYRQKFLEIQREMKELRDQMTSEKVRLHNSRTIRMLEAERNWYREELLQADSRMKKLEAGNKQLRDQLDESDADRKSLHDQLMTMLREKKQQQQRMKGRNVISPSCETDRGRSSRLQTTKSQERGHATKPITPSAGEERCPSTTEGRRQKTSDQVYEEAMLSLRRQLEAERKTNRQLKAEKVTERLRETELREFFVSCLEEVKRDILARQKAAPGSAAATVSGRSHHSRVLSGGGEAAGDTNTMFEGMLGVLTRCRYPKPGGDGAAASVPEHGQKVPPPTQ